MTLRRVSPSIRCRLATRRRVTPTFSTTTNVYLVGNEFAQRIYGNQGNNILDADNGKDTTVADSLYGGAGNDIYRIYSQNDIVSELAQTVGVTVNGAVAGADAGGTDTVYVSSTYSLLTAGNTAAIGSIETLSLADQQGKDTFNLTGTIPRSGSSAITATTRSQRRGQHRRWRYTDRSGRRRQVRPVQPG